MGISLYMLLFALLSLCLLTIKKIHHNKEDISRMTGMMTAMTLGMGVGLIAGVVFGILLVGNLFSSTIWGMGAGIIIGLFAGLPLSVVAILDGMLSGLMGGMMGAMLGEMIPSDYREAMVKILFLFFVAVFSLLLQLIHLERRQENEPLPNYPLLAMGLFVLFSVIFHQFGPMFPDPLLLDQEHSLPAKEENKVTIQTKDFSFGPSNVTLRSGEKVILTLENQGEVDHDLEIIGLTTTESHANDPAHEHGTENLHLHASPGEQATIAFIPAESGIYQFVCTLPRHEEAGMVGTFTIS
ncbi:plastocyanin/azurin family copper-binding protein [Thalassobacillus devorans]|uniref:plastocyanin/azurin family copper-binding protein n=1 Tax=Thalassobacillus devorans TaxID=279813 RepID=UPI00048E8216|nr:plastocyanin/azurin family copper-binding protein [Thalassobacillus devorans]